MIRGNYNQKLYTQFAQYYTAFCFLCGIGQIEILVRNYLSLMKCAQVTAPRYLYKMALLPIALLVTDLVSDIKPAGLRMMIL